MKTYEELYTFAKNNNLQTVKDLLRNWIDDGQPDSFMEGFTSRAVCRCAPHGLSKEPIDEIPRSYIDTEYGFELYHYMWRL